MSEIEDFELVQLCQNGDRAAIEQLVVRHQKAVYNIALRMTGRIEDAQDIAKTVFLKAFQNLATFRREHKFFSWVYRMAINEAINLMDRRKPQEVLGDRHQSTYPDPSQQLEAAEIGGCIAAAVTTLSPEYRAVIVLRHFEELSYDEIAATLGISEKKVKSRLFSARRLLCAALVGRGVQIHD